MADLRIAPVTNTRSKVKPVSQTLPKSVPVAQSLDLPEDAPQKERRKQERRKGQSHRRPLVELRSGEDRRHSAQLDTEA